jgi:predicted permease
MPREIPLSHNVHLDFRVLAFAALVTMGTAVLVGLVPTLRALRRPTGFTATGRATRTRRQRRLANGLLSLEVAQAAALLVGAGLLIHSLLRMTSAETGFRSDGLVYAHLVLPGYAYDVPGNAGRRALFLDGLRDRVSALPGVRSVGVASASPFSGMTFVTGVELEGGRRSGSSSGGLELAGNSERAHFFSRLHVDPGYLQTLDLPVVAGRSVRPEDETGQSAGIINETAARAYWPNESPLGKRIFEAGPRGEGGNWITIVGVVRDFDHPGLPTRGVAELYLPLSLTILETLARPTVIVRYDGADDGAVTALRREIWTLDPDLPIPAISTATTFLGASLAVPRFYSVLLGSFAALALLLAGVGIYGVVAHTVAGRTREIGIRLALGATAGSVGSMIAKEGFIAVTIGLAGGLAVGIAASRLMSGLLFDVGPADPLTSAAVAVVLLIVAGFAIAVPAARAMRANTLDSLRSD